MNIEYYCKACLHPRASAPTNTRTRARTRANMCVRALHRNVFRLRRNRYAYSSRISPSSSFVRLQFAKSMKRQSIPTIPKFPSSHKTTPITHPENPKNPSKWFRKPAAAAKKKEQQVMRTKQGVSPIYSDTMTKTYILVLY